MKNNHPFQTLLALVGNVFNANSATLFLPSTPNKEELKIVASWCPNLDIDEKHIALSGKGYVGWVVKNEKALLVPHTDINISSIGYYKDLNKEIKTFFAYPVSGGGVLVMDSIEDIEFDEEMQKLCGLFTRLIPQIQIMSATSSFSLQISTYFYAIEAIHTLTEKYTSWQVYIRALLQILSEATGFEYVSFASRAENAEKYSLECENQPLLISENKAIEISVQNGVLGWVLKNGEAIFNDGINQATAPIYGKINKVPAFVSTITMPIEVEKKIAGAICLASRSAHPLSPELRTFMKLTIGEVSNVLERMSLRFQINSLINK